MPMHDADLDTYLNKNSNKWDFNIDNINKWWEETFSPQEFLCASKLSPIIQNSNYYAYTINNVLHNHSELNKLIQTLLKDTLLPFENLFNKKLGTCTGEPLHFRLKPNATL